MDFKKITLVAKSDIWRYLLPSDVRNCDFSFANLCSWWFLYRTEYALVDNFLVLRFYLGKKPVYMIYKWYEPDRRRDKDNISSFGRKVIQDALVNCKIIKNDGWRYIEGFEDHFYVDSKKPGIEVEIIEQRE